MKFTTAAQIVIAAVCCSLATHVVCGSVVDDVQSSSEQQQQQLLRRRRRAMQTSSSSSFPIVDLRTGATVTEADANNDLHVFGPVVFNQQQQHQQGRRQLVEGGYLVLFDDSITDIERHAKRLAKELNKVAKEIMTATIHAVYMEDLTDDDVAYIRAYPGVKEIDANYKVQMYNLGSRSGSASPGNHRDRTTVSASSGEAVLAATTTAARGSSRRDLGDEEEDPETSSDFDNDGGDIDNGDMFITAAANNNQLTDSQKERNQKRRRKQQMMAARPDKPGNLQAVSWNINRVGGPHAYYGNNKVYIIDTGIDMENADLNVNKRFAKNFLDKTKPPQDDHGHGTYCAGIIGAKDNKIGVVGVRPGVRVVPLKALDKDGNGDFAVIIAAVEWVARHGKAGDVVNMSLGGGSYPPLDDAVRAAADKKIWFVVASGNEAQDSSNVSPAHISHPYVLTVSAMDNNDRWSEFSNWGTSVDVASPGQFIQSTNIGGGISGFIQGTSFAAPHVAALKLGKTKFDGKVKGDPDGKADAIIIYNGN